MIRGNRRLIVGTAGSANSFGTIQSVRDHYGDAVFVVATDSNPRELVAASVVADAFVQVPLARAPEFPAALRDIAASYPGSYYLPVHDDELEIAARLTAEGRWPDGLELIAPPLDVVRLCSDKWLMHQWLRERGLPSPETKLATPAAFESMRRPAILKPREGYGSRGVQLIHESKELVGIDPNRWLLQEQLQDPMMPIDVFLGRRDHAFFCACRETLESRATVAMKARVFNDPVLAKIARSLALAIPLFGAFVLNVMKDAASRPQIIDVNARVGSGTRMLAALGSDFAAANLADYWGEPTDTLFQPLTGEHFVVRQYAAYATSPITRSRRSK